jgi:hypothetical protein
VFLSVGVAKVNHDYNRVDPLCLEINITHPERIATYDETRLEMDCTKGGKGNRERNVKAALDDDGEGVVTKSDACAHDVCCRLGDYQTMPPMLVFNFGDSLDASLSKTHVSSEILDKDGKSLP